jgi:hypothetical protein
MAGRGKIHKNNRPGAFEFVIADIAELLPRIKHMHMLGKSTTHGTTVIHRLALIYSSSCLLTKPLFLSFFLDGSPFYVLETFLIFD